MYTTPPVASYRQGRVGIGSLSGSLRVWVGVLVYLATVKLTITLVAPHALADPSQAALFTLSSLSLIWLVGLIGVWLAQKTGFPDALAPEVSTRTRLVVPALGGFSLGVVFVALDQATGFTAAIAMEHGLRQQYTGFLPMLLVFPAAAVIVEVVYRLLPIPLGLWLVSRLILHGKAQVQVFWMLALLTSLIEPMSQFRDLRSLALALVVALVVLQYGFNVAQAALFRKYGFIAPIVMRMAFYVVFHVLYVH